MTHYISLDMETKQRLYARRLRFICKDCDGNKPRFEHLRQGPVQSYCQCKWSDAPRAFPVHTQGICIFCKLEAESTEERIKSVSKPSLHRCHECQSWQIRRPGNIWQSWSCSWCGRLLHTSVHQSVRERYLF